MAKKILIDLRDIIRYADEDYDKRIRRDLRKNRMYNQNLIYSIFNGYYLDILEKTGNYRPNNPDDIYAFKKEELIWESEFEVFADLDIRSMISSYENPAIAIYDKRLFFRRENFAPYSYSFKFPNKKNEALVAIAFFKFGEGSE